MFLLHRTHTSISLPAESVFPGKPHLQGPRAGCPAWEAPALLSLTRWLTEPAGHSQWIEVSGSCPRTPAHQDHRQGQVWLYSLGNHNIPHLYLMQPTGCSLDLTAHSEFAVCALLSRDHTVTGQFGQLYTELHWTLQNGKWKVILF